MRHLCESGLRENCTSRLSGGRRPALRGASSDPTPFEGLGQHNPARGKGPYFVHATEARRIGRLRPCR